MTFSRSMQRLLRLRESLERQEELKMALTSARLQAAQAAQATQHAQQRTEQESQLRALKAGTAGSELQASGLRQGVDEQRRERLNAVTAVRQSEQAAQRGVLLGARRDRETLTTLSTRFQRARQRERTRREQAAADEAYLLYGSDTNLED